MAVIRCECRLQFALVRVAHCTAAPLLDERSLIFWHCPSRQTLAVIVRCVFILPLDCFRVCCVPRFLTCEFPIAMCVIPTSARRFCVLTSLHSPPTFINHQGHRRENHLHKKP